MKRFPTLKKLLPLAMAACGLAIGTTGACAATSSTPNVLLVLTDDVGIDQLRTYGYGGLSAPPTPNLQSLLEEGLTFRNAWTMPACSTARGVLYTGRFPFRTQMEAALGPDDLANSMISPWENTLPKLMGKAGYATALFGKFHIGLQGNNPYGIGMPAALGWDYFNGWLDETGDPSSIDTTAGGIAEAGTYPLGYVPGTKDDAVNGADAGACYQASGSCSYISTLQDSDNPAGRQCRDSGGLFRPNLTCVPGGATGLLFGNLSAHYVSPLVINEKKQAYSVPPTDPRSRTFRNVEQTDAAIDWIQKQQKRGKPWFATVSTATVHTPMQVPPVNTLPPGSPDANGVDPDSVPGRLLIADQMIQAMDHEFGRLLVSTNLAKQVGNRLVLTADAANTVIVYVNDNGSLGSQVRQPFDPYRSKGTPYQTGVWTPMVVAGPVVKVPGKEVTAIVNIADLYEFIGALGGVDVRKGNPRIVDSAPIMPYFANPQRPSIRKYDFTLVGPNLQADDGINGPCQFESACSQIPVTKSVCEDNGGIWFGKGATGTYPTADGDVPIPDDGRFKYCCQVQVWIKDNNGTPLAVVPETGIAVRDTQGFKLVRNQMNDYDAASNSCVQASYDELYKVNQDVPMPLIDREGLDFKTPYKGTLQAKYQELAAYMNQVLASKKDCPGDGNDDGVVNQTDLKNYDKMRALTKGSSWYDVNLDGVTDSADRQVIISNLGKRCR